MVKRKIKPYIKEFLVVTLLLLLTTISYLFSKVALTPIKKNSLAYVSFEILTDNSIPVLKEKSNTMSRPYSDSDVIVAKNYYDYTKENTEDSIIYYQDTYLQNTGIDYSKSEVFDVKAILDGTVLSVTENDIVGKIVKIEHQNNIISVYESLGNVTITEGEKVTKGQTIGISGTNSIASDIGNHLHFELYVNNVLVNPELYYNIAFEEGD